MIEIKCTGCGNWLPRDCYTRDRTCSSGYRSECKSCRRAYNQKRAAIRHNLQPQAAPRTTEAWREQQARNLVSLTRAWVYDTQPAQLRATIGGGYV